MSSIKKLNILNYKFKAFIFFNIILFFLKLSLPSIALGQQGEVNSDYCTIYFHGEIDLRKVDKRLNTRFIELSSRDRKILKNTSNLAERIALKCDIILLKSEQILDMYPAGFHVNIIIFENKKMLIDAYQKMFWKREDLYSFYVYENNTIYTTQLRINQNLLAHEFGHAIVNHYFLIRPPETVRELISQYIDIHLED